MEINEKNDLKQSVRLKKRAIDYYKAFKRNIWVLHNKSLLYWTVYFYYDSSKDFKTKLGEQKQTFSL